MSKEWQFAAHDEFQVRQMSGELGVSALLAQVLISRGLSTGPAARRFLSAKLVDLHEPDRLPGISEATERVITAIQAKRRITIYGDYDVDGVTATALLWHCLKLAGAEVDYYIPHRLEEGYGLNCDALRHLHEEDPQRLLITVDCGICSLEESALANQLGLELIITDHHNLPPLTDDQVDGGGLPQAACLVHPRLPNSNYPFTDLCGAGVAFKLAWGICQRLGDGKKASPRMREFLMAAVGIAAIGTVADVVPLLGENRILVQYGLTSLPERSNPGLKALMKVAGIDKNRLLQAEDIAFALAPRLNAAGRLGQARLAVELLTTDSEDRSSQLATYLDELNKNRQTVERRMFKQAKQMVKDNQEWQEQGVLVMAHHDWHAGVVGIVANRIAEQFEKPTILISLNRQDDIGQGSGRSFGDFDLHSGLLECSDHLMSFGGHRVAAGLKISSQHIDEFRTALCGYCAENHKYEASDHRLNIDAEVRLADLTHQAVSQLDRLGPFGRDNPRPIFATTRVELAEPPRKIGAGERHLALKVRHYGKVMRAIAFGRSDWADEIATADAPISICFAPNINRFRGQESVEMQLIDWRQDDDTQAGTDPATIGVQSAVPRNTTTI